MHVHTRAHIYANTYLHKYMYICTYTHTPTSVAVQDSRQEEVVPTPWTTADAALAERDAELQQKDAMLLTLLQRIPGLAGEVGHLNDTALASNRQHLGCA